MLPDSLSSARRHRRLPACSAGVWAPLNPPAPGSAPPESPSCPFQLGMFRARTQVCAFPSPKRGSSSSRQGSGRLRGLLGRGMDLQEGAQHGTAALHPPEPFSLARMTWKHLELSFLFCLAPSTKKQRSTDTKPLPTQPPGTHPAPPCSRFSHFFPQHPKNPWLQCIPAWGGGGLGLPCFAGRAGARAPRRAALCESRGLRHPMRRAVIS